MEKFNNVTNYLICEELIIMSSGVYLHTATSTSVRVEWVRFDKGSGGDDQW